jgi:hypothetical protein
MAIEMLFNNKIQIIFLNWIYILKIKIYNCAHYWRKFMNKFSIFSFGQIINKVWIIKFEVLCNV